MAAGCTFATFICKKLATDSTFVTFIHKKLATVGISIKKVYTFGGFVRKYNKTEIIIAAAAAETV